MKFIIAIALVAVSMVSAEPPRFQGVRQSNNNRNNGPTFQRQVQGQEEAPYAPSGWKPQGEQFTLPTERQQQQEQQPSGAYGPPQTQTQEGADEDAGNITEEPLTTTTERQSENLNIETEEKKTQEKGPYYVVLSQKLQQQQQQLVYALPAAPIVKQQLVYAPIVQRKPAALVAATNTQVNGLLYPVQKTASLVQAAPVLTAAYTAPISSSYSTSVYTAYPQQQYAQYVW